MMATRMSISDARQPQPRRAVLRQPPFGNIEAGENLDARNQRLRQRSRRRRYLPQQPVDAQAHHEPRAKRLDMDVAGAQFDGFLEQIVDGAHHRRAAGKIAQALDVVVARRRAGALVASQSRGVVLAETLRQRGLDILK